MADSTTKHSVHKVGLGATGYSPSQLDVGVPSMLHLLGHCHATTQLPKDGAIEISSKYFQILQTLYRTGKGECFPDLSALVDELSSLYSDVVVHSSTLMQLMPKVCG